MQAATLKALPNALTMLRVALALPIAVLLTQGEGAVLWVAFGLMVVAEVSDLLDGHLARRLNQVSATGKILDPMADSVYRGAVFIALAANHWMPAWMLLLILWRDVLVSDLRVLAETRAQTMGARFSGKLKAVAQGVAQLGVVFGHAAFQGPGLAPITPWLDGLLAAAAAITAYSLADYAVSLYRPRSETTSQKP